MRNLFKFLIIWLMVAIAVPTSASGLGWQEAPDEPVVAAVPVETSQTIGEITTLPELQAAVDAAAVEARAANMTIPVVVPDGTVIRCQPGERLTIPSHVFVTTESGIDRSGRIVARGLQPGESVIEFTESSFSAGIRGFSITYADADGEGITGIRTSGLTKNALVENCHIDFWRRMDCVGLEIRGHESVIVRRFTCRSSVPIIMAGGDNHHLSDLDITAATSEQMRALMNGDLPATCVWIKSMPNQWTFGGSFTAQGGDHAFFGRVSSPRTGQVLAIEHLRYEQSLSVFSEDKRAIDLAFDDRALERLVLVGCRWGENREKGLRVTGCWSVQEIGCYLHGTYWWRRDP